VPSGWRSETIPFPLDFAPSIPLRGAEQIRFMPHFFDPKAPTYFSYVFVWEVEGSGDGLDDAQIAKHLETYFRGLCTEVGGSKYTFDPARYRVTLAGAAAGTARGTALLYDAFTTGAPLALELDVRRVTCAAPGHRAILVLASPKPRGDAVWTELARAADSYACP
jgi:hypothetical protein